MSESEQLFIYNDFWAERSQIEEKEHIIESIRFVFLKLTSAMIKELCSKETVAEKLSYAADNGISWNRERIIDNENLKKDLSLFWDRSQSNYPPTPSIKQQAGEYVCGISGLSKHIKDTQELEDDIKKEEMLDDAHQENKKFDEAAQSDDLNLVAFDESSAA